MKKKRNVMGFTLIELMVCVAIFAIVTLAVQQVMVMVFELWRRGDTKLQMYQHGRFALDYMGVYTRCMVRPDMMDYNGDGLINATDTGVTGTRMVGVSNASQAVGSAIITSSSQGFGYGYEETDAMCFHAMGYSNDYNSSDMVAWEFGCSNELGSTNGVPVIYMSKLNINTTHEGNNKVRGFDLPTDNGRPRYLGTTSLGGRDPSFYYVRNLTIRFHDGTTASGSALSFWDTANHGHLPSMVFMGVEMADEHGSDDTAAVYTSHSLMAGTGLY